MKIKFVKGKHLANECAKHQYCTQCKYYNSSACAEFKTGIYKACSPAHIKNIMEKEYQRY